MWSDGVSESEGRVIRFYACKRRVLRGFKSASHEERDNK